MKDKNNLESSDYITGVSNTLNQNPLEALEQLSKLVFIYGGAEQYKIIEKTLKGLEILKRFNNYNIIQIQDQWYILQGDSFFKSLKISITEEEAVLLKEVLL